MPKGVWICTGILLPLAVTLLLWLAGGEKGSVASAKYDSRAVRGQRSLMVYLPPAYPRDAPYPVLYLLHGAGDDETAWYKHGSVKGIMDRLHAQTKLVPMIVVMPNGIATTTSGNAFAADLLQDLIPYVDAHYQTRPDREGRAIAGLSMGGAQALRIGLTHLETFAWVGGFAPSMLGRHGDLENLIVDAPGMARKLKLLWISCGQQDGQLAISASFHAALEANKIPHVWHVGTGEHEWKVWKDDLRLLTPLLFRAHYESSMAPTTSP